MKTITLVVLHDKILKITNKFTVEIPDNGNVIDAIAAADIKLKETLGNKPFPIKILNNLLQLLWNPKSGEFYVDLGVDARDANNEWLPIADDPFYILPNDSRIFLTPDAGC